MKNMSKYDKMLEQNRKRSEAKVETALHAVQDMVMEQEKITVPELMRKTGFSRGFFYKNPIVRKAIDNAMEQQVGMVNPKRKILDQAMDSRIELLQQQIAKLKAENSSLKSENLKLNKALGKKDLNIIKNL
ncbi:hypothetical protein A8806_11853 [Faecalicatena orotica]|uniref:Transposase n=2 Tax=Faecalicatena orotica TaxID=1544 RepID=A0A2Y9BPC9_9FIRM|nr:hypothetical protein A8806_11853 [Faecalicatena orotica]SSA58267.1 hypothetical protein SAMN05216536_11853 [Faecalicatena orotica]